MKARMGEARYDRYTWGRLWLASRSQERSERNRFNKRSEMRMTAHAYAEMRGWQVALTPPQRQKGIR